MVLLAGTYQKRQTYPILTDNLSQIRFACRRLDGRNPFKGAWEGEPYDGAPNNQLLDIDQGNRQPFNTRSAVGNSQSPCKDSQSTSMYY